VERRAAEHHRRVEAALHGRSPDRYLDPVAVGGLIVSIATLAWTVYKDLENKSSEPSPDVIARTIRVRLREQGDIGPELERVIDVVVGETLKR